MVQAQFAELALPLFDALYNFACWLTKDRAEAEDLVQETYVKALAGFGSFVPGTSIRAWMYRILRNSFLNARTSAAARQTVALEADETWEETISAGHETPETVLLEQVRSESLRAALGELPPAFREVLLLADMEEMSYREIAATLDVPIGTVMSRLARARRRLRQQLQTRAVLA